MCPRHEELDRAVPEDVFHVLVVFRRHLERRDPVDVLARDSQGLAAGAEQRTPGLARNRASAMPAAASITVLTVVDDQQSFWSPTAPATAFGGHGCPHCA
jgi:hypothetical protein